MAKFEIPYEYETVEEYPYSVRIERYHPMQTKQTDDGFSIEGDEVRYRVVTPNAQKIPEFDAEDTARLWVDVYFDVGGFREEKTGDRGVPPEVAAAGKDTLVAYLVTQRGMSTTWATRFFDISRETVHSYCSRVRSRARAAREELTEE